VPELRVGPAVLEVCPEIGGAISRYAFEYPGLTIEWLRRAPPDSVTRRAVGEMSCFPMVPFSNRVRNATFRFGGRQITLAKNFPPEPHAIHGHAWQAEWEIVDQKATSITIEYRHSAGSWPWSYRARQSFILTPASLRVQFSVTNQDTRLMPVGFGLHPFFVRTRRVRIRADVAQMWRNDRNKMPVELVEPPADLTGRGLNPDGVPLDNNFIGFSGSSVIEWPEWRARLRMRTDPIFECLVVYTPAGQDFFCVEPATNCVDSFNLAERGRLDTGLIVLEPGETRAGTVVFIPTLDS